MTPAWRATEALGFFRRGYRMSQRMSPGRVGTLAAAGLAALLAWWLGSSAGGGIVPGADGPQPERRASALPPDPRTLAGSFDRQTSTAPASAQPVPSLPPAGLAMVPLTLTAPPSLQVGEQAELVVGLGAHSGVDDIAFTVRFDPNILQVRAGTPGEWSAGDDDPDARFAAEIPEAADHVKIRGAATGGRAGAAGGTVAVVQFQAVAPGTTKVTVTDMTARDRSGSSMPMLLSMSTVHVTAEAAPLPGPGARPPLDVPANEAVESGDQSHRFGPQAPR